MNITERSVYKVLRAIDPDGLTTKELLVALNQRISKKTQLRKTLRKLAQKKIAFKKDNRYYLTEDHTAPAPGKEKRKASLPAGIRRQKASKQQATRGTFLVQEGSTVVFCPTSRLTYVVDKRDVNALVHGDEIIFSPPRKSGLKEVVRVEEIRRRNVKTLYGHLEPGRRGQWFFRAASKLFPQRFRVVNPTMKSAFQNQEVFLEITKYPLSGKTPEGTINLDISGKNAQRHFIEEILNDHRIITRFSRKVEGESMAISQVVRVTAEENRKDLRDLSFFTIDGDDAKDFDDAVYVESDPKGYRLWVSIADVAAYVPKDGVIDREARSRGTSVYLPGRAIPMLPEVLSNGVCSLKKGVNRKALTCEMVLDDEGKVLSSSIYRSVNRIARRFTYDEVDTYFESGRSKRSGKYQQVWPILDLCGELASALEKKRALRGALDFSLPDTRFYYGVDGAVSSIGKTFQTPAQKVIEQFMLEANETVARFCQSNGIPIVWRNHPPPLPEKLRDLNTLFWRFGIPLTSIENSHDINEALKKAKGHESRDLLEYSVLRALSLAIYETKCGGHFGIGATHYCHFTSPIRRYPDLVTHRAVIDHLEGRKAPRIPERVAELCSEKEQAATKAERQVNKLVKMLFMADHIGQIMEAKVVSAQKNGCFIEIDAPYLEGYLPFASISDDNYIYDERTLSATGKRQHREIIRGQKVKVLLSFLDKRFLLPEFSWVEWL